MSTVTIGTDLQERKRHRSGRPSHRSIAAGIVVCEVDLECGTEVDWPELDFLAADFIYSADRGHLNLNVKKPCFAVKRDVKVSSGVFAPHDSRMTLH